MAELEQLARMLSEVAHPLRDDDRDYDELMRRIGEEPFVLLGEASHGTHEFYRERARITKRLIEERLFTAVAVEADWPDAYRVNRYVLGRASDRTAIEALGDFARFPTWMWRNTDVVDFIDWLRAYNEAVAEGEPKVGFYGLDLYSLNSSIDAVVRYLDSVDPEAARRARFRYSCFEDFGEDTQTYGYEASMGLSEDCQKQVIGQLAELREKALEYMRRDGMVAEDEYFYAEQNARVAQNAEAYYRSMFAGRDQSWNLRDRHMADTLDGLAKHLSRHGRQAKIAVWEHNSHVGDARATEMGRRGELNVGQLARERYGRHVVNVGFTTYSGSVSAATNWDAPVERKTVRPGRPDSYEALFHAVAHPEFLLIPDSAPRISPMLREPRLERAIGVIYRPETERVSHYFQARLADQFDAIVHLDETRAVEPLERTAHWIGGDVPETYPSGI